MLSVDTVQSSVDIRGMEAGLEVSVQAGPAVLRQVGTVVDKADSQLGVRWILAVGRHQYDQVAGNLASAFEDLHHTHRHWLAAVPVLKMINRLRIHRISTCLLYTSDAADE